MSQTAVSGRSWRMTRMMNAGRAPSPRVTRQISSCEKSAMMKIAITASVKTSPIANMNCQRLPITSRLPFGINSMM